MARPRKKEMSSEILPNFLIIGAQKAGTTTLYGDLSRHPSIAFGRYKEPGALCREEVLSPEGRRAYAGNYRGTDAVRVGDATTDYTKRTRFEGVPSRARRVLGVDLRLIYLVREPIARAISHHYHGVTRRTLPGDFGTALKENPSLVDNGRYAFQLAAWLEEFRLDQIRVVRFEDYMADRIATVEGLVAFLDLPLAPVEVDDEGLNRSGVLGAAVGGWACVQQSRLYRATLRRALPDDMRLRIRARLLPGPPPRPELPTPAQVEDMLVQLVPDAFLLGQLLGATGAPWDFDAVRARYSGDARAR